MELRLDRRALGGAPGGRLQRAPERDRLADRVAPADPDPAELREPRPQRGRPRGVVDRRRPAEPHDRVVEVAPHELGPEHAVARRAVLEHPRDELLVGAAGERAQVVGVGNARVRVAEQVEDRRVLVGAEVLARLAARAAATSASKYSSGRPATPVSGERRAQQRRSAAGRRADGVGDGRSKHHHLGPDSRESSVREAATLGQQRLGDLPARVGPLARDHRLGVPEQAQHRRARGSCSAPSPSAPRSPAARRSPGRRSRPRAPASPGRPRAPRRPRPARARRRRARRATARGSRRTGARRTARTAGRARSAPGPAPAARPPTHARSSTSWRSARWWTASVTSVCLCGKWCWPAPRETPARRATACVVSRA